MSAIAIGVGFGAAAAGVAVGVAGLGVSVAGQMGAFGGGPEGTSSVKNGAIAGANNALLSDFQSDKAKDKTALSEYITRYLAGYPDAQKRTSQEISAIDQFYNGDVTQQLTSMRASRTRSLMAAADRASRYAAANNNRSLIGHDGVGSSYGGRMLTRGVGDVLTAADIDNANQERQDWGAVNAGQLALAGKRRDLADSLSQYGLQPTFMRQKMNANDASFLGTLQGTDSNNTFYGLKQDTTGEDIAGILGQVGPLANQIGGLFPGRSGLSPSQTPSNFSSLSAPQRSNYTSQVNNANSWIANNPSQYLSYQ